MQARGGSPDGTAEESGEPRPRSRHERHTDALLKQLFESATDAVWLRDPDGCFQLANAASASIMGRELDDVIGTNMRDIWPPEVAARLADQSERLFAEGVPITVEEQMFDHGQGGWRTFLSNKVPLFASDGSPTGILGISRDITDRKLAEDKLRSSQEQLAQQVDELNALYGSAPLGLAFFSRDYRYLRVNRQLAKINGKSIEEHIGRPLRDIVGNHAAGIEPIIDRVFETGEAVGEIELSGSSPDEPSVERHWLIGFYPVRGGGGEVAAVGAWLVEVSDQKAAEQRELLLAREVDHRAKNLLAVVQSIVQLTPIVEGEDLKERIVGRIQALARAHSLLSDARWQGVGLGDLVREELAPFSSPEDGRVAFDGPALLLRPAAAQSLGLVLHELATNAAKYGSLSTDQGRLSVQWRHEQEPEAVLVIEWTETGGPDPGTPELSGFGSQIVRASVNRQLRGTIDKRWRPDGLDCTIRIPALELVPLAAT